MLSSTSPACGVGFRKQGTELVSKYPGSLTATSPGSLPEEITRWAVNVREKEIISLRLSKGNATQNFYLHVGIKSWPFKMRDLCSEVSFPDSLDCLRERSMEEHFFSPECSSVRRQGLELATFWNHLGGIRLGIIAGSGLACGAGPGDGNHPFSGLSGPFWFASFVLQTFVTSQWVASQHICFYYSSKYRKNFTIIGFLLVVPLLI